MTSQHKALLSFSFAILTIMLGFGTQARIEQRPLLSPLAVHAIVDKPLIAETYVEVDGGKDLSVPPQPIPTPKATEKPEEPESVEDKILKAWGPTEGKRALKVAFCESSHNPKASHSNSSAKGLFQIIDGTWRGYKCEGDPLNPDDNIACAYKIYQRNGWGSSASWKASQPCHGYK